MKSCRLSRTYTTEGRYTVTVTMDDRAGGVTSRTFMLNVSSAPDTPSGFGTFYGNLDLSDPLFNRFDIRFLPPTAPPCIVGSGVIFPYDTYAIHHVGGPLLVSAANPGTTFDTYLHLYAGSFNPANACQNIVASWDYVLVGPAGQSQISATFPAGDYVVVVTTRGPSGLGPYVLVIQ